MRGRPINSVARRAGKKSRLGLKDIRRDAILHEGFFDRVDWDIADITAGKGLLRLNGKAHVLDQLLQLFLKDRASQMDNTKEAAGSHAAIARQDDPAFAVGSAIDIAEWSRGRLRRVIPHESQPSGQAPALFGDQKLHALVCRVFHKCQESPEERPCVMRTGRGFRMVLKTDDRQLVVAHALDGPVVEIHMR